MFSFILPKSRFPVSSYSTDNDYSSHFVVTYRPLAYHNEEKSEYKTNRYLVMLLGYWNYWDTIERIDKKANPRPGNGIVDSLYVLLIVTFADLILHRGIKTIRG
jgi:hypothetical protein